MRATVLSWSWSGRGGASVRGTSSVDFGAIPHSVSKTNRKQDRRRNPRTYRLQTVSDGDNPRQDRPLWNASQAKPLCAKQARLPRRDLQLPRWVHQAKVYRRENLAAIVVHDGKSTVEPSAACRVAATINARPLPEQMAVRGDVQSVIMSSEFQPTTRSFIVVLVRQPSSNPSSRTRNSAAKGYRLLLPLFCYGFYHRTTHNRAFLHHPVVCNAARGFHLCGSRVLGS